MKFACAAVASVALLNPLNRLAVGQWVEHPAAIQTVYQAGVPHTDRTGGRLDAFDAKESFFPLAL